jgi:hypothetical protein
VFLGEKETTIGVVVDAFSVLDESYQLPVGSAIARFFCTDQCD